MPEKYRSLAQFVRRIQRKLYIQQLMQTGVTLLILLLLLVLLGIGAPFVISIWPPTAPLYSGIVLVSVLLGLGLILVPAFRPISHRQALSDIEQTYPELHDDLTNALELDPVQLEQSNPRGIALDLVHALHQQTARQVQQYTARAVTQRHPLQGLTWCGLFALTAVFIAAIQPSLLFETVRIVAQPLSYLPPHDLTLTISPEHITIAKGTNLEVQARAATGTPRQIDMAVQQPGKPDKRYQMEAVEPNTFRYAFLKPQTSFTFWAQSGRSSSPPGHVYVVPAPAIGNLKLHYSFPAYTKLAERYQEGGGDIRALPGTQVQLTMQANVPLTRGVLRFATGSELPLDIQEQTLQGGILVMEDTTYSIQLEDTHGLKNTQPPWYTVQLTPDLAPTVKLITPGNGQEVDETTILNIRYEANDDFGLQDASIIYTGIDGVKHRVPLHLGHFEHRRIAERFSWDMYQYPLPDGDTVQMHVEIYDNDMISGLKKGISETITLTIRNRQQEHQALEELQKEISDTMLDLLADHLELADQMETAADDQTLSRKKLEQSKNQQEQAMERAAQLSKQIDQALSKVQKDPYTTYETFADLQVLQQNMNYMQQNLMPKLQQDMQALKPASQSLASPPQQEQAEQSLEDVIRELERLATLANDISTSEKFHNLMQLSTKMMEKQNQMLSAMHNLSPEFTGDDIPLKLQQMLETIDQLIQDMADTLTQLPKSLPDEFLNQQLATLPISDMNSQLDAIKQNLAEGNIEGAKERATQLLKTLSTTIAAIQNMMQQSHSSSMAPMLQQLQQSSDTLTNLIQRQEDIIQTTQHINQETLKHLNAAQQHTFETMQAALQRDLGEAAKHLSNLSRQARQHPKLKVSSQRLHRDLMKHFHTLQVQLNNHDIPKARQSLDAVQRQLAHLQQQIERLQASKAPLTQEVAQAQEFLQSVRRLIDSLPQDRQAMLTRQQRGKLDTLTQHQEAVQNDTTELHQKFDELRPLIPFLPSDAVDNLRDAVPFMQQAQDEISARQTQLALPPEREALEHLHSAQNTLQQALQQLAQRGRMMGQSIPVLQQSGRLPAHGVMQQRSVSNTNTQTFQLPDKKAYKVPRMFREDIADALKQGYPERYKEMIKQYYRNIVR